METHREATQKNSDPQTASDLIGRFLIRHDGTAWQITGKNSNRLINEALEEYLPRFDSVALRREIERQCRRANRADAGDDWEAFADLVG